MIRNTKWYENQCFAKSPAPDHEDTSTKY